MRSEGCTHGGLHSGVPCQLKTTQLDWPSGHSWILKTAARRMAHAYAGSSATMYRGTRKQAQTHAGARTRTHTSTHSPIQRCYLCTLVRCGRVECKGAVGVKEMGRRWVDTAHWKGGGVTVVGHHAYLCCPLSSQPLSSLLRRFSPSLYAALDSVGDPLEPLSLHCKRGVYPAVTLGHTSSCDLAVLSTGSKPTCILLLVPLTLCLLAVVIVMAV